MSEKFYGISVTLERPLDQEHAEKVCMAIKHLRHVADAVPCEEGNLFNTGAHAKRMAQTDAALRVLKLGSAILRGELLDETKAEQAQ